MRRANVLARLHAHRGATRTTASRRSREQHHRTARGLEHCRRAGEHRGRSLVPLGALEHSGLWPQTPTVGCVGLAARCGTDSGSALAPGRVGGRLEGACRRGLHANPPTLRGGMGGEPLPRSVFGCRPRRHPEVQWRSTTGHKRSTRDAWPLMLVRRAVSHYQSGRFGPPVLS